MRARLQLQNFMAHILSVVRNPRGNFDYSNPYPLLVNLQDLLTRLQMPEKRQTIQNMRERAAAALVDSASPKYALKLFTDWVPDPRSKQFAAMRGLDRAKVSAMVKATTGGSQTALVAAALHCLGPGGKPSPSTFGWGGVSAALPSAPGWGGSGVPPPYPSSLPFFPTPSQPAPGPTTPGVSLGSLSLPLAAAVAAPVAAAPAAARGGGGNGQGAGGGKRKNKKAQQGPPAQVSPQVAQVRVDYNNALQARQQAALPHPAGLTCSDCVAAGRTPHHSPQECAFSECHHCRQGGHRARKYSFPKYQ